MEENKIKDMKIESILGPESLILDEPIDLEKTICEMTENVKNTSIEMGEEMAEMLHSEVEIYKKMCEAGVKDNKKLFYTSSTDVSVWLKDMYELLSSHVMNKCFKDILSQLYRIDNIQKYFSENGFQYRKLIVSNKHGLIKNSKIMKSLYRDALDIISFTFGICNFGRAAKDSIVYTSGHATTMRKALNVSIAELKSSCGFIENFVLLNLYGNEFPGGFSPFNILHYFFSEDNLEASLFKSKKSGKEAYKEVLKSFYDFGERLGPAQTNKIFHFIFIKWAMKSLDKKNAEMLSEAFRIGMEKSLVEDQQFDPVYIYDALESLDL